MDSAVPVIGFDRNVFINCPFDKDYMQSLKCLLYSLAAFGFKPRIALERLDSAEIRLGKIKELIESSRYSIHDLSRAKSKSHGEYSRLNMPFELGIDMGCREYHPHKAYRSKRMLILEEEKYSIQKALSDMAGADCKCHKGDSEELVLVLREWFTELGFKSLKAASAVWDDFNFFYANLQEKKILAGFKQAEIERMPISEFIGHIDEVFAHTV